MCHSCVPEKSSFGSNGVCTMLLVNALSAKMIASRRGEYEEEGKYCVHFICIIPQNSPYSHVMSALWSLL